LSGLFYFGLPAYRILMWNWLEQYFTFTGGEKKGILALIFLSTLIFLLPKIYFYLKPVEHIENQPYEQEIEAFIREFEEKKLLAQGDSSDDRETFNPYANVAISPQFKTKREIEYFEFDPNKIGLADWMRLGFSEKQAASIEKGKAKGWKFYKPEDLKKMYVIGEENYNRLAPYIKIEPADFPKKEYPKPVYAERAKEKYELDINTADSSLFERQRGLGPVLAGRIVKYRARLGGFVSPEQIKEVWGMPDSTYQSLKDRLVVKDASIIKINVNSADFETLRRHPYINYTYAKIIKAYREQHGNFKNPSELRKIPVINDSIFARWEPYIDVE
jgi:competence protein ComEA